MTTAERNPYIQIPCLDRISLEDVDYECSKAQGHTGDHRDNIEAWTPDGQHVWAELTWESPNPEQPTPPTH